MKDGWDKFHAISTFISGVLIASIGLVFTLTYNVRQKERQTNLQEQEMKILELGAMERYIPHLVADDEDKKEAAVLMIEYLANKQLALAVVRAYPKSRGVKKAGNTMMTSTDQADLPPKTLVSAPPATPETESKEGWAYLGDFYSFDGKWITRYFDFPPNKKPTTLEGKTFKVRRETGALNVREGMPTPKAEFLKVIDVLKPGSSVKIHEVETWESTGYIWARISYLPQRDYRVKKKGSGLDILH